MKSSKTKQTHEFTVQLSETEGNGDFLCPLCGTKISPDDETEKTYSLVEAKVNSLGLEEVIICCKKCESTINLRGFSEDIEIGSRDKRGPKKEVYFFNHI